MRGGNSDKQVEFVLVSLHPRQHGSRNKSSKRKPNDIDMVQVRIERKKGSDFTGCHFAQLADAAIRVFVNADPLD